MKKLSLTSKHVREIRQKLDKTQAELADLIHVSVHTIRAWENGERVCVGPACKLLLLLSKDPEGMAEMIRAITK